MDVRPAPLGPEPQPTAEPPSHQSGNFYLNEDQFQRFLKEMSSSRSSGSGSQNDNLMVPHISTVYGTLSQLLMRQERVEHEMSVMNGRAIFHDDSKIQSLQEEIKGLKYEIREFKEKADWIGSQVVSNKNRTENAEIAFGQLTASVNRLTGLLEQQLVFNQPPPQPLRTDFSQGHPRAPPPHASYRPTSRKRGATSSRPSMVSSDEE